MTAAPQAHRPVRLLIVGPQGSGKGTQGVRIAQAFGIPAISTGDVFRGAVADGSELGQQVKAVIEAGDLVPDELTSAVVRDRLAQPDAETAGFLLDGYPRNLAQVARPRRLPRRSRRGAGRRDRAQRSARREHRAAVAAREGAGPHRRHRRGHRQPSRDLRARDGADPRCLPRTAGSSRRSTASARSTRSPSV